MASLSQWLDGKRDLGLLILRAGLGAMFVVVHGVPKLLAGPERWVKLGAAMGSLGITFAPVLWGLAAAVAEGIGGLLLVLGLLTRASAAALVFTMLVAAAMHLDQGDGLKGASHAIEVGLALLALVVLGPGRFSIDARLKR